MIPHHTPESMSTPTRPSHKEQAQDAHATSTPSFARPVGPPPRPAPPGPQDECAAMRQDRSELQGQLQALRAEGVPSMTPSRTVNLTAQLARRQEEVDIVLGLQVRAGRAQGSGGWWRAGKGGGQREGADSRPCIQ